MWLVFLKQGKITYSKWFNGINSLLFGMVFAPNTFPLDVLCCIQQNSFLVFVSVRAPVPILL